MSSQQHVIVIGAGIIGASIAWHLARRGAAVTVVAEAAGGVATPASFAWINASWGNPEFYFRFRRFSMTEWHRLADELPGLPLRWCGGVYWDLSPDQLEAYAREHASWGYGIRRVDGAAISRLEPQLARGPGLALAIAEEGAVEPVAATHIMLADARKHAAELLVDAKVTGLIERNGRVKGVRTAEGELHADHVVLAAGAGVVPLARSVGVSIPLETPPGLIVHSRPCSKRLNGLVIAPELHMRQTAEGRIIAGSDFGGSDPGEDPQATAAALFAEVKEMLRESSDLELDFFTIGYRPTPVDGFPIIDKPEGSEGLSVAVLHSGVTLAPAVGRLVAGEILDGIADEWLTPYRLSRFG